MKKYICLLLAAAVLGLCGCGDDKDSSAEESTSRAEGTAPVSSEAESSGGGMQQDSPDAFRAVQQALHAGKNPGGIAVIQFRSIGFQ